MSILTICLCVSLTCVVVGGETDDRKALTISFFISTSKDAKLYAGAFFEALDTVNGNLTVFGKYKLDFLFNDTNMNSLNAINSMTEHHGAGTIGFIGPDASCLCESTIAAAWNLPMIAFVSNCSITLHGFVLCFLVNFHVISVSVSNKVFSMKQT